MRPMWIVLLGALAAGELSAQPAATLPERGGALVAATPTFVFYSDPVTNLHDFLVWSARSREPVEPVRDCLEGVPAEQRSAFERAREHYRIFATPAGNRILTALRYRLAGFGDFGIADAADVEAALAVLPAAAAAYEACWWPAHDARNRRWIAEVEPLLAAHEEALSERLGELYGQPLERPFPVDIVSHGSYTGADSVVNPDHLLVSSVAASNAGYAALEILFHEASHTVFGPGPEGRLWTELQAAAAADGAPLPLDFWHAMLFYTTGAAVRAHLAERGIDYEQILYAEGLLERAWPAYRDALERLWQPYVDGRVSMAEALKQIVAAHKLPERGDTLVGASRTFVFYSDPLMNLHDFLAWNARSGRSFEPAPDCVAGLPAEQRIAFEDAVDHYATMLADDAGLPVLYSLRWRLAELGNIDLADPAVIGAAVGALAAARPAYETCWWREHDARNRRWIADVLPLLDANEGALRARLEQLYGQALARSLPVDVVGYADADGLGTLVNPHHLLVSSAGLEGYDALEVVLRQASLTIFSQRTPGPLWSALHQASGAAGKSIPEEFLWRLVFFTTGAAVEARLAEQGVTDHEALARRESWPAGLAPEHREILERVWRPYVDGRLPMAEAARGLVEALPAAPD